MLRDPEPLFCCFCYDTAMLRMPVVSFRIAVAAHGTRASATHTAGIRNIAVS